MIISGTAFCPDVCKLLLKVLGVVALHKKIQPPVATENNEAAEEVCKAFNTSGGYSNCAQARERSSEK
jgi:hypothetical protein